VRSLNPPFRADHVGSLLRPRRLLDARARFCKSEMTKEQLRAVEDDAIREVVRKLCDPQLRAQAQERGDDPNQLPHAYAALINAVIDKRPRDLTVAIHLCRGNMQSAWVAEGGYEPVADALFNELHVDACFLEYDDERSGDFEPLRFVPHGKTVVLGLVSTKTPKLESARTLTDRIKEAARYVPLDNLCLSPQCGFASTIQGNEVTEADQWAKLELVVNTARDVWGGVV
jgi:5-methyltetrahydropteroyltriglutamate--homocysteine methyltransferase